MTVELDVQRSLTKSFIDTAPLELVLKPRNRVRTSTGGWMWQDAVPRAAQVMRLCFTAAGISEVPVSVAGEDGAARKSEMMLLGEWDSELDVNDTFEVDGHTWIIDQVYVSNGWERRAAVVRHG